MSRCLHVHILPKKRYAGKMRSLGVLALLAGCGFHTHAEGVVDDAAPTGDDAPPVVIDASPDAPPDTPPPDTDGDGVPDALDNCPMAMNAGCRDGSKNFRGAEKAPSGRAATNYRAPVATYDDSTGTVTWGGPDAGAPIAYDGGAAQLFGKDSWKYLLLQPSMTDDQE